MEKYELELRKAFEESVNEMKDILEDEGFDLFLKATADEINKQVEQNEIIVAKFMVEAYKKVCVDCLLSKLNSSFVFEYNRKVNGLNK